MRDSSAANENGKWILVGVVITVVSVLILVPIVVFFHKRLAALIHAAKSSLRSASRNTASLTSSDMDLLTRMIRQSGFLRPGMEFTLPHAFHVGKTNYLGSDEYSELPGEQRWEVGERIEALKNKLGADRPDHDEMNMTTRNISVGAEIMVSYAGTRDNFEMVVLDNTDEGLRVHPPCPPERISDTSWILRYFDGAKVWGFTTPVLRKDGDDLLLKHTSEMEMVNYRRFARVPVNLTARLSRFLFHASVETETETALEFVHADVVEIGGPGVMLKTSLSLNTGERILILLDFGENEIIQAVGKIRRVNNPEPQTNLYSYGAELVGMKPSQIAELMHVTNSAAIRQHKEEESEPKKNESSDTTREVNTVAAV